MRRNHKSRRRSVKSRRTARRRSRVSRRHTGKSRKQRGGSFSYTIPDVAIVSRRPTSGGEDEEDAVPTLMTKADMDRQTAYD